MRTPALCLAALFMDLVAAGQQSGRPSVSHQPTYSSIGWDGVVFLDDLLFHCSVRSLLECAGRCSVNSECVTFTRVVSASGVVSCRGHSSLMTLLSRSGSSAGRARTYALTGTSGETDECASSPCQNGAVCTDHDKTYNCDCPAGYTGDRCQTDTDECSPNPCQNGAVCIDHVNAYSCDCPAGYTGDRCQTDTDECAPNPCQNGAHCTDHVNSYSCDCPAGYTGDRCQTDTDECATNPCQNGAVCTDHVNAYSCDCPTGYTGDRCQTDVNECFSNPCQNGGRCVDVVNGFRCRCREDYTGPRCQHYDD